MNNNNDNSLNKLSAFYEVVKVVLDDGNGKDIATKVGRSYNTVIHWGDDPEINRHPIPASMILPLCVATNDYRPLTWLCQKAGGLFIQIPSIHKNNLSAWSMEMSKLANEFAGVVQKFSDAIADGKVTEAEKEKVVCEINELISQAVHFREAIR